jgi:hypothetical protein
MVDDQTRWRAADLRDMAKRLRTVSDCLSMTARDRQLFACHAADMDNEAEALEGQVTGDRRHDGEQLPSTETVSRARGVQSG